MKNGYFKTKKRLEIVIDNIDKIDGLEDYLNNNFIYLFFDTDNQEEIEKILNGDIVEGCPYWLEQWKDNDNIFIQYHEGYYYTVKPGDIVTEDNINYKLLDTIPLPEEMEHQADDGGLVYENRGYSFMSIFKRIN